jgi:arginyl-tRNA synthetase
MDIKHQVKQLILEALRGAGRDDVTEEMIRLEHPEVGEYGDYATNAALLLKGGRELAEKIVDGLKKSSLISKAEVAGPGFVNISINIDTLINNVEQVLTQGCDYGKSFGGKDKRVIIDYSAPNIAKAFGIGHLRSTIIGQALHNIFEYSGYEAIGDNHLGDWGTQFGKLLFMIDREKTKELTVAGLEEMYVEFHKEAESQPQMEEEARKWFKKLEDGDEQARTLWKRCVEVSTSEFNRIYELLDVKIDETFGESFYESKMRDVIEDAWKAGVAKESDGALIIEIPGMEVPLMLLKSDGGTTYATRDLATIKFRIEKWHPEIIIYEVGVEQALHFEQVFAAARILGYADKEVKLVHTRHGMYLGPDGKKFKTREGKTVKLEGILDEAIERAKKLGNTEAAKDVGIGAIKYFDLKHTVTSDIVFEWEKMFALTGNSGPYLQYTFARTQSVLGKAKEAGVNLDIEAKIETPNAEEAAILKWLYRFPETVEEAMERYAPNLICNFLFDLSQKFNTFYNQHSILSADNQSEKNFRLALTAAVGQIVKNGLTLLGIAAPEKM